MKQMKVVIFLVVFLSVFTSMISQSFSKDSDKPADLSNVSFSTHSGMIKFFDHTTGKVYFYGQTSGKVLRIWELSKLGEDMVKVK